MDTLVNAVADWLTYLNVLKLMLIAPLPFYTLMYILKLYDEKDKRAHAGDIIFAGLMIVFTWLVILFFLFPLLDIVAS
ncbi:MAG: hypothetical protein ACYSW6_09085 [Planctomycetota bacterium]